MKTLMLRFVNGDASYEFEADADLYPLQITNGFNAFVQETGKTSGQLEVLHDVHGWNLVCIHDTYPIISNPLALDFHVIALAIYETVVLMETWPIPAEHKHALFLHQLQAQEEKKGEVRRGHLRLVK